MALSNARSPRDCDGAGIPLGDASRARFIAASASSQNARLPDFPRPASQGDSRASYVSPDHNFATAQRTDSTGFHTLHPRLWFP